MTHLKWLERFDSIDKGTAALPPRLELEKPTLRRLLNKYSAIGVQAGEAHGVGRTNSEVEKIMYRIVGVKNLPPLEREATTCSADLSGFVQVIEEQGEPMACYDGRSEASLDEPEA